MLEMWATEANMLSNVYRSTLEPLIGASGNIVSFTFEEFVRSLQKVEDQANALRRDRNTAWVYLGECELRSGNQARALAHFIQALNFISGEDAGNLTLGSVQPRE